MSTDPGQADYWNDLYAKNDTGWDKGVVSPPIERMLRSGLIPAGSKLLVVGAGKGHEALKAASLSFDVTALDFAALAIESIRKATPPGVKLEALQRDLFELPSTHPHTFDAVLEHTCFCAIPIAKRPAYVEAVWQLLKPQGALLGLFYAHGRPGGPPFDTTEPEVRGLFEKRFEVQKLSLAPDSFENRQGAELEAFFRAKPA